MAATQAERDQRLEMLADQRLKLMALVGTILGSLMLGFASVMSSDPSSSTLEVAGPIFAGALVFLAGMFVLNFSRLPKR